MGSMSTFGRTATPLFTSRFMWIATFGITSTPSSQLTKRRTGRIGLSPRSITAPASPSGRSSQVFRIAPP